MAAEMEVTHEFHSAGSPLTHLLVGAVLGQACGGLGESTVPFFRNVMSLWTLHS